MKRDITNLAIEGHAYTARHHWMDLMRAQKFLRLTLAWLIQDLGALTLQCLNVEKSCIIKQCPPLFHVQFKVESLFMKGISTLKSLNGSSILMKVTISPQHTTPLVYQNVWCQLPHWRVFVVTPLGLAPISLTTWPILTLLWPN